MRISVINKLILVLVLLTTLVMHLPFLSADPDKNISFSRGPWTDEGLYTSQVRNSVNGHSYNLYESDALVKTPLYGALTYPVAKIFSSSKTAIRLFGLSFLLSVLFIIGYKPVFTLAVLIANVLMLWEYHIFQFSHFALAEIIVVCFMLMGLFFFIQSFLAESKRKVIYHSITASLAISMAFFTKVSFIYLIFVPIAVCLIEIVRHLIKKERALLRMNVIRFGTITISSGVFVLLFYLLWYLPNEPLFNHVLGSQTADRLGKSFSELWGIFQLQFEQFFELDEWKMLFYLLFATILGAVVFFLKKASTVERIAVLFGLVWVLIELHKFSLNFVSTRYLITFLVALILTASLLLQNIVRRGLKYKITAFGVIVLFMVSNLRFYINSYDGRTYELENVNTYLSQYEFDRPIMGPWSPTLAWDTKAQVLPIWNNYFNDDDVFARYNPKIIITEADDKDTEEAFVSKGIDLAAMADSVKSFQIKDWKLNVYWLP